MRDEQLHLYITTYHHIQYKRSIVGDVHPIYNHKLSNVNVKFANGIHMYIIYTYMYMTYEDVCTYTRDFKHYL